MNNFTEAELAERILGKLPEGVRPAYLFIGSTRSTGDLLGPLSGSMMESEIGSERVFGTIDSPVHALNLLKRLPELDALGAPVVAIDAGLSRDESHIGSIVLEDGIQPGNAVGKNLPKVGDASLTAILEVEEPDDLLSVYRLQSVDFAYTLSMARTVSRILLELEERTRHFA